MKELVLATAFLILIVATPASAANGVVDVESMFNVEETANRIVTILNEKGMIIFNRIKHSESAGKVGVKLRPTELIIFGNPKVGGPLMVCQQSVAIDLPQKALIWQDDNDKVWISYNDPKYLKKRHGISDCEAAIEKIEKALANIVKSASTK